MDYVFEFCRPKRTQGVCLSCSMMQWSLLKHLMMLILYTEHDDPSTLPLCRTLRTNRYWLYILYSIDCATRCFILSSFMKIADIISPIHTLRCIRTSRSSWNLRFILNHAILRVPLLKPTGSNPRSDLKRWLCLNARSHLPFLKLFSLSSVSFPCAFHL